MKQKIAVIALVIAFMIGTRLDLQAQWVRTNGPYGGTKVTSMATLGTYLFAVADGKIIRSSDNGSSWIPVNNGLPKQAIDAVASSGTVLFAGFKYNYYGPVYVSIDSGASWKPDSSIATIGPFATIGNNLFAGTGEGVLRSTDKGTSWTPENTGLLMYYPGLEDFVQTLNYLIGIDSLLFAFTDGGLLHSNDNGVSWTYVDSSDVLHDGLYVLLRNGIDLLVGNNSTTNDGHVYRSSDNGTTWSEITHNLNITALIGLTANGKNIFAGSWHTGISRSTDGGASWAAVHGGIIDSGITALTMLGTDVFTSAYGVFRSTDNGTTWKSANLGITDSNVTALFAHGPNLFAGAWTANNNTLTSSGIYRSGDHGASWSKVYDGYADNFFAAGNTIFANLYYQNIEIQSTDNGNTWTQLVQDPGAYSLPMSVTATNQDLFEWRSGTRYTGYGDYDVMRSTDHGITWNEWATRYVQGPITALAAIGTDLFAGAPVSDLFGGGIYRSRDNGGHWIQTNSGLTDTLINAFAVIGNNLFAGTGAGVFLSSDLGATWASVSAGLQDSNVGFFATIGNMLFASTDSGLFRSQDNGTSWTYMQNGFLYHPITSLATIDQHLFVGTSDGIFLSSDNGIHFTALGIKSPHIAALAANGPYLFAGGTQDSVFLVGGVFRSSDNGATWIQTDGGLTAPASASSFASIGSTLFAAGDFKSATRYYSTGKIFRSADNGSSWDTVFGSIGALAVQGADLFVGTGNFDGCRGTYSNGNVFLSADNGANWIRSDLGLSSVPVLALAANGNDLFLTTYQGIFLSSDQGSDWYQVNSDIRPTSFAFIGQTIFVGGAFGVYRSTDSSVSWQPVNFGLKDKNVNALASVGTSLLAGTNSGLYFSSDKGTHWIDVSAGLPKISIPSILATATDLFVGTRGEAVWRRPLSDLTNLNVDGATAVKIGAHAYPNPFSRSETIDFSTSVSGYTQVSILNLLGAEVTLLLNGELDAGEHSLIWDAKEMPPGMYVCIIRTKDRIEKLPIMLIR